MATDDRKAQIGVGVDTTDAKKGFEEVKQGARDMARDVAQSGQAAAKGMDAVGTGGAQAAQKVAQSTSTLTDAIKRSSAAAGEATKSWSEFLKDRMGPAMREFTEQGLSRTEAHAAAIRRTAEEWRAYKAAAAAAATETAKGEQSTDRADRATRSLIGSIQRATAAMQAGSQSSSDYYRALAGQRGASAAALEPYLRQLDEATRRQQQMAASAGVSAAQTAAAMRSIPAQFTDIVTQLAGGANPLLVLTQQGGQLKDMFGGLGPAVRGFGSYLAGLINPATAAGAAVLALAVAYEKGTTQSAEFARMIALTGNAAGLTEGRFNTLAATISETTKTTIGSTRETLQSLAATGQLSGQALEKATAAAQLMSKVTGQAADAIVKQFAGAAEAPAKFAAELNKSYNFLTAAELQHIRALEDQGRTQEALTRTFDALNTRLKDAAQNFGTLERWWDTLKRKGSEGIDFVLRIGRVQTTDAMLEGVREQIAKATSQPFNPSRFGGNAEARAQLPQLRREEAALATAADEEAQRADAAAKRAQGEKDVAAAFELQNKHLDKQGQLNKAIRDYATQIKTALESTTITAEQRTALLANYDKNIKEIRDKFTDKGAASAARSAAKDQRDAELEGIKGLERQRVEAAKQAQDEIRVLRATGVLDERQAIEENTRLDVAGLTAKKASLEEQLALMSKRKFSEKEIAQVMREVAEVDAQIKTRMLKGENDLLIAIQAREDAWARATQAENASFVERQQDRATQLQAEVKAQLEANAAIGKSAIEIAGLEVAKLSETAATKERLAAEAEANLQSKELIDAYRAQAQALRDLAAAKTQGAVLQANADTAKKAKEDWERTSDQIGQALANSLMEGGKSAGDYLKGLFRTMVLQPVIKAIVQPVAGAVASLFAPAAGAASAGGGGLGGNGLGLLSSAGNFAGMFGAGGFAGALTAGAGWLTGSTTLTGALTAAGSLIGTGTAGGIASGLAMGAGALGPIALGALALGSLFGLGGGRTYHTGGGAFADRNTSRVTDGFNAGLGLEGHISSDAQKFSLQASQTIAGLLNALGGVSGGGNFGVNTAFADDSSSDGAWGGLLITRDGKVVMDWNRTRGRWAPKEFADGQAGQQQYVQALASSVRGVLDGIGLPSWAKKMLDKLGDSPSLEQLAAVADQVVRTQQVLAALGNGVGAFAKLTGDAVEQVVDAFGGLDAFASSASGYVQALYTDSERLNISRKQLEQAFKGLGLSVPATAAGYRALVEAQNLNTESGRKAYATLISLSSAFGELTKAVEQASQGVQAEIERLRGTSGVKDVATLQAQFAVKTAQARAGDTSALQALPEISKALEQARTATATSAADVAFVRASLAASLSETLRALKVPGFAAGGWHDGGWRVVGERGPELEYTPPARIYSNPQSQQLLNTARLEQQLAAVTEKLLDCEEKLMAIALHSADTSKQLRRAMPEGDALAVRNAPDTTLAVTTGT